MIVVHRSVPGYQWTKGEKIEVVVDVLWQQHNKPRQLTMAVVESWWEDTVTVRFIGTPWEDPPINEDPVY